MLRGLIFNPIISEKLEMHTRSSGQGWWELINVNCSTVVCFFILLFLTLHIGGHEHVQTSLTLETFKKIEKYESFYFSNQIYLPGVIQGFLHYFYELSACAAFWLLGKKAYTDGWHEPPISIFSGYCYCSFLVPQLIHRDYHLSNEECHEANGKESFLPFLHLKPFQRKTERECVSMKLKAKLGIDGFANVNIWTIFNKLFEVTG